MCIFFEARKVYQHVHGQRVMNYAGAVKTPTRAHQSLLKHMYHGLDLTILLGNNVLVFPSLTVMSVTNSMIVIIIDAYHYLMQFVKWMAMQLFGYVIKSV